MRRSIAFLLSIGVVALATSVALDTADRNADRVVPARFSYAGTPSVNRVSVRHRVAPLRIRSARHRPDLVSPAELVAVLRAAVPIWHPPSIPSTLHEIRLWGPDAQFSAEMAGRPRHYGDLIRTLLDDARVQREIAPSGSTPFLLDSAYGVHVALLGIDSGSGERVESHYGQLLKALAESGVSASTPVRASSGRSADVSSILQDAVLRFSLEQELEFIASALALWLPPVTQWRDAFGNSYDFDALLVELIQRNPEEGACAGCHVPYAVVQILRADEQCSIVSHEVRRRAVEWLCDLSLRLVHRRLPQGGWDRTWCDGALPAVMWGDPLLDRITVTGHHLEWIALAPLSVSIPDAVIRSAVEALVRDVEELTDRENRPFKTLLPASHAARGLALLRGDEPWIAWETYWKHNERRGVPCSSSPDRLTVPSSPSLHRRSR